MNRQRQPAPGRGDGACGWGRFHLAIRDVRFGRNGTQGQASVKDFADAAKAVKHVEKLICEKVGKGYVENQ